MVHADPAATGPGPEGRNSGHHRDSRRHFSRRMGRNVARVLDEDGHLLWEYNMIRDYETVNHVSAKGGSMGAPGPTVAGGMLFAGRDTCLDRHSGQCALAFAAQ